MFASSHNWMSCFGRMHKDQVAFLAQVTIAYTLIITSIINISISSENTCLWATLASGTIGCSNNKHCHFYMTLPSDSFVKTYPDNTIAHCINKLARPIHLDGDYEVAMTEFIYSRSFHQVDELQFTFTVHVGKERHVLARITIPGGHYANETTSQEKWNSLYLTGQNKMQPIDKCRLQWSSIQLLESKVWILTVLEKPLCCRQQGKFQRN